MRNSITVFRISIWMRSAMLLSHSLAKNEGLKKPAEYPPSREYLIKATVDTSYRQSFYPTYIALESSHVESALNTNDENSRRLRGSKRSQKGGVVDDSTQQIREPLWESAQFQYQTAAFGNCPSNTRCNDAYGDPAYGSYCYYKGESTTCKTCPIGTYGPDGKYCYQCQFATWSTAGSANCSSTFTFSSAGLSSFYVPWGVSEVNVKLWGAGGGSDNSADQSFKSHSGGSGAYVSCNISVSTGDTVYVIVGGGGEGGSTTGTNSGGYGGGGDGRGCCGYSSGGGGGRSAIQKTLGTDDVTAGAGGGGSECYTYKTTGCGGGGGGGRSGASNSVNTASGRGASNSASGAAGYGTYCKGTAGSKYTGGDGCVNSTQVSAGGGGGYYGGGGGSAKGPPDDGGGGGGGSSYVGGCKGSYTLIAGATGNAHNSTLPGYYKDDSYISGVAVGAIAGGVTGGNGLVIIEYIPDYSIPAETPYPSSLPTSVPTRSPHSQPTMSPVLHPTSYPSSVPSNQPTSRPTVYTPPRSVSKPSVLSRNLSTTLLVVIFSCVGFCILVTFIAFTCYFHHKHQQKDEEEEEPVDLVEEEVTDEKVLDEDLNEAIDDEVKYYRDRTLRAMELADMLPADGEEGEDGGIGDDKDDDGVPPNELVRRTSMTIGGRRGSLRKGTGGTGSVEFDNLDFRENNPMSAPRRGSAGSSASGSTAGGRKGLTRFQSAILQAAAASKYESDDRGLTRFQQAAIRSIERERARRGSGNSSGSGSRAKLLKRASVGPGGVTRRSLNSFQIAALAAMEAAKKGGSFKGAGEGELEEGEGDRGDMSAEGQSQSRPRSRMYPRSTISDLSPEQLAMIRQSRRGSNDSLGSAKRIHRTGSASKRSFAEIRRKSLGLIPVDDESAAGGGGGGEGTGRTRQRFSAVLQTMREREGASAAAAADEALIDGGAGGDAPKDPDNLDDVRPLGDELTKKPTNNPDSKTSGANDELSATIKPTRDAPAPALGATIKKPSAVKFAPDGSSINTPTNAPDDEESKRKPAGPGARPGSRPGMVKRMITRKSLPGDPAASSPSSLLRALSNFGSKRGLNPAAEEGSSEKVASGGGGGKDETMPTKRFTAPRRASTGGATPMILRDTPKRMTSQITVQNHKGAGPAPRAIRRRSSVKAIQSDIQAVLSEPEEMRDIIDFFKKCGLNIVKARDCGRQAFTFGADAPRKLHRYLIDFHDFSLLELGMDEIDEEIVLEELQKAFGPINPDDDGDRSNIDGKQLEPGGGALRGGNEIGDDMSVGGASMFSRSSVGQRSSVTGFHKPKTVEKPEGSVISDLTTSVLGSAFDGPRSTPVRFASMESDASDEDGTYNVYKGSPGTENDRYSAAAAAFATRGLAGSRRLEPPIPEERPEDVLSQPVTPKTAPQRIAAIQADEKEAFRPVSAPPVITAAGMLFTVDNSSEGDKSETYDCYLSHEWTKDEKQREVSERVGRVREALEEMGLSVYSDPAPKILTPEVKTYIGKKMDKSRCILVFVTQRYMGKVNGMDGANDMCKFEFEYAAKNRRGRIVPIIMEGRMRSPDVWKGQLSKVLKNKKTVDMSEDDDLGELQECDIDHLQEAVDAVPKIGVAIVDSDERSRSSMSRGSFSTAAAPSKDLIPEEAQKSIAAVLPSPRNLVRDDDEPLSQQQSNPSPQIPVSVTVINPVSERSDRSQGSKPAPMTPSQGSVKTVKSQATPPPPPKTPPPPFAGGDNRRPSLGNSLSSPVGRPAPEEKPMERPRTATSRMPLSPLMPLHHEEEKVMAAKGEDAVSMLNKAALSSSWDDDDDDDNKEEERERAAGNTNTNGSGRSKDSSGSGHGSGSEGSGRKGVSPPSSFPSSSSPAPMPSNRDHSDDTADAKEVAGSGGGFSAYKDDEKSDDFQDEISVALTEAEVKAQEEEEQEDKGIRSGSVELDCYFSHDWSKDEYQRDTMERVKRIKRALREMGLKVISDDQQRILTTEVRKSVAEIIKRASCVICFVTQRYMGKVNGIDGANDICKYEFEQAVKFKKEKMVTVVLENRMRSTGAWKGQLSKVLGAKSFVDMVDDDPEVFEADVEDLYQAITIAAAKKV